MAKINEVLDKQNKQVRAGDTVLVFYPFPNSCKTEVGQVRLVTPKGNVELKGIKKRFAKFYKLASK